MRCPSRNCGVSFKVACGATLVLELAFSGVIGALCIMSWIKEGKPTAFLYTAQPNDNYLTQNTIYEGCVVLWCLTILMTICIWRIVFAVVLYSAVRRNSSLVGLYWIAYKIFALILSMFVLIAAFTTAEVKVVAIAAFVADCITSYFIIILIPELDNMKRAVVIQAKIIAQSTS